MEAFLQVVGWIHNELNEQSTYYEFELDCARGFGALVTLPRAPPCVGGKCFLFRKAAERCRIPKGDRDCQCPFNASVLDCGTPPLSMERVNLCQ